MYFSRKIYPIHTKAHSIFKLETLPRDFIVVSRKVEGKPWWEGE
jgi:hypothetical protein